MGKHHIPAPDMCHHAHVIRRYDTLCTRQSKRGSVFVYVHWLGAKGEGCFTDLAIPCRCAQPRRQLLAFGVRPCTTVVAPGPTLELTTKLFWSSLALHVPSPHIAVTVLSSPHTAKESGRTAVCFRASATIKLPRLS